MSEGWIERVSVAKGRQLIAESRKKAHKYHAKQTVVDGVRFDSKAEAAEYSRLLSLWSHHVISDLELQPVFELHAPNGEVIGKYLADFRFKMHWPAPQRVVVVDVKGFKTAMYRWKKKHVEAEYGIRIEER